MIQIKKHDYVKINAIQSLEFGFYFLAGDILVFNFFHPRATLVPLGIFFFFERKFTTLSINRVLYWCFISSIVVFIQLNIFANLAISADNGTITNENGSEIIFSTVITGTSILIIIIILSVIKWRMEKRSVYLLDQEVGA